MKSVLLSLSALVLSPFALLADDEDAAGTRVEMRTSRGTVVIELNAEKAPITVANFLQYVDAEFYDNTIFHRVIDGFMIQGGGFDAEEGEQKEPRAPIQNEAKNGLTNDEGTIAMARTGDPHSASAQFFINVGDNDSLNFPSRDGWGYAVFGRVVEGMEVVNEIKGVETGRRILKPRGPSGATAARPMTDVPTEDVVIISIRREGEEAEEGGGDAEGAADEAAPEAAAEPAPAPAAE